MDLVRAPCALSFWMLRAIFLAARKTLEFRRVVCFKQSHVCFSFWLANARRKIKKLLRGDMLEHECRKNIYDGSITCRTDGNQEATSNKVH